MNKKLYVKPSMRVKPIRISNLICSSFRGIQLSNSSDDDDPDYDGNSSGDIWYAN